MVANVKADFGTMRSPARLPRGGLFNRFEVNQRAVAPAENGERTRSAQRW